MVIRKHCVATVGGVNGCSGLHRPESSLTRGRQVGTSQPFSAILWWESRRMSIEMLDRFVWRGVTQVRILSIQAYFHYVEELRHHFRHNMDFLSPGTHSSLHSQYYSYNTYMYICIYIHLFRPIGTRLSGGIAAMHIYICVFIS